MTTQALPRQANPTKPPAFGPFPLLGVAAAMWILTVDLTTGVRIGGQTVSSLLTVAIPIALAVGVGINVVYLLARPRERALQEAYSKAGRLVPGMLVLFLLYSVVWLAIRPSISGVQNIACYAMLILSIVLAATSLSLNYTQVARVMFGLGLVACVISLAQTFSGVVVYGDRTFAMTCLILLAIAIPASQASNPRAGWWVWLAPIVVMVTLTLTLSRTATAVGALLMCFLAIRARRGHRVAVAIGLVITVSIAVFITVLVYPPILDRFTTGDNALEIGGISFNTSGRALIWQLVYDSAIQAPILGHGPGNAAAIVDGRFDGISQPHNDYLRIFNDFGAVGLVLFWGGMIALFFVVARRAIRTDEPRHWTAVLAMVIIFIVAVTDNILVYQFVLMPAGVLIGMSLRPELADWRSSKKTRTHPISAPLQAKH